MIDEEVLRRARQVYGNKNQILVCMEELNELACVLAKYPRYTDENVAINELYDKALDEVADVSIIIEHVKAIFKLTNEDLSKRIERKIDRLNRWLNNSNSMQETIDDREVVDDKSANKTCESCLYQSDTSEYTYLNRCRPCYQAQATEGEAPYKRVRG